MLKEILELSINKKASDIILSSGAKPCLKIGGEIKFLDDKGIITKEYMQSIIISTMNESQKNKFMIEKELDYGIGLGSRRFRVNAFMTKNGVGIVCRPIAVEVPDFGSLGLPDVVKKFAYKKNGLVLITGSVGSGKSTSMISLVNEINKNSKKHIITIEDPIEFIFENDKSLIEQREVENSTLSFENGLKYALRQAPDVIMLGEMRDLETFRLALRAAETGNLVIATLHTSGAARTVSRIIDMFPSGEKDQVKAQLSESLIGVVWQNLLKSKDEKSRVLACEVLLNTTSISNTIRKGDIHQIDSIIETSSHEGMLNMTKCLSFLYKKGKISDEVYEEEINLVGKDL